MKTLILLIAVFQAMGDTNGNPGETFKQNSSNIELSFIYNFKFLHAFAQSGLEVALAIKDSTINDCTFTIYFVCGNLKSWFQVDTTILCILQKLSFILLE